MIVLSLLGNKNKIMETLITNTGQQITVCKDTFAEMEAAFNQGFWCVLAKDLRGILHSIILPENFKPV